MLREDTQIGACERKPFVEISGNEQHIVFSGLRYFHSALGEGFACGIRRPDGK